MNEFDTKKFEESDIKPVLEIIGAKLGSGYSVTYQKLDNKYVILANGEIMTTLTSDMTLNEALTLVNNKLENYSSSIDANNQPPKAAKKPTLKQNYYVNIDVDLYQSFLSQLGNVISEIENAIANSNNATSCLNGELKKYYAENYDISNNLIKVKDSFDELVLKINTVLKTYQNIDSDLMFGLTSLIDEIFSVGNKNGIDTEYSSLETYEEKEKYLNDMIANYENVLSELKDEYQALYGNGIEFENFQAFEDVFKALGIYDALSISDIYDGKFLNIEKVGILLDYCNTNDVFTKIKSYLNDGKSWDESGLSKFDNISSDSEITFLRHYYENITNKTDDINATFSKIYGNSQYNSEDIKSIKNYISENFDFEKLDTLQKDLADCRQRQQDILTIEGTLYNYKQYQKLMPFEEAKNNLGYLEYLGYDYNDYDSPAFVEFSNPKFSEWFNYLDRNEIALYCYLYENDKDKGIQYLNALQDTVNQRIGFDRASKYVSDLNVNGFEAVDILKSGFTGWVDGNRSFFNGLSNLISADGIRSSDDYEFLYKSQLLSSQNSDYDYLTSNLTTAEKAILSFNYQLMNSVGNMTIPMLTSFIPVVGKAASSALMWASSAGNATENAMQSGANGASAYLYGALNGLSEVAFEKILGGIPGISDGIEIGFGIPDGVDVGLKGVAKNFIMDMFREGKEEFVQSWIDAGLRSTILGEDINLVDVAGDSIDSAIMGMLVSGVMKTSMVLPMGIANKLTNKLSNNKFSSYADFKAWVESEFKGYNLDVGGNNGAKIIYDQDENLYYLVDFDGKVKVYNDIAGYYGVKDVALLVRFEDLCAKLLSNKENVSSEDFINFSEKIRRHLNSEKIENMDADLLYRIVSDSNLFDADSQFSRYFIKTVLSEEIGADFADKVLDIYGHARKFAAEEPKMGPLFSYCDHTENHVSSVALLTAAIAIKFSEGNVGSSNYAKLDSSDVKTLVFAGILHDLGMDYNGRNINSVIEKLDNENGKITSSFIEVDGNDKLADQIRTNHTNSSAEIILENRAVLERAGINPDKLAYLVLSHSKSNSGLGIIHSESDASLLVAKIVDDVNTYNAKFPDSPISFNLDSLGIYTGETGPATTKQSVKKEKFIVSADQVKFKDFSKLSSMVYCLRMGDAYTPKSAYVTETPIYWTYNGESYSCERFVKTQRGCLMGYDSTKTVGSSDKTTGTTVLGTETSNIGAFAYFRSEDGHVVPLVEGVVGDGSKANPYRMPKDSLMGEMNGGSTGQFLCGEANTSYSLPYWKTIEAENYYYHNYTVSDFSSYPECTIAKGIVERIEEVNTSKDVSRKFGIEGGMNNWINITLDGVSEAELSQMFIIDKYGDITGVAENNPSASSLYQQLISEKFSYITFSINGKKVIGYQK